MLCNLCKKNQATVHLTEIIDDQMSELHLCDECARKKSMQMEQQFGLSDLLAGLADYSKQLGGTEKVSSGAQCKHCGLNYEDFRKIGRLGCSECYEAFAKYLGPLLKRIHGANQHVGKLPVLRQDGVFSKGPKESLIDIVSLKDRLQQAILSEEFELAAQLRDAIKEAEARNNSLEKSNEKDKKKKGNA
ncbi:MAG: UvrB/UvrC motif-containing protein [Candidatus Omnitrophota bacterium]